MGFLKTIVAINRGVVFFIVALGIQLSAKKAMAEPLAIGFNLPKSQYINNMNAAKLGLGGSCTNPAAQININLGSYGSASAVCQDDKTWSVTNINAVDWADGKVVLKASYSANPSVYAAREFSKDTINPIVKIVYPANGTVFTAKNLKPVAISGICNSGSVLVKITDSVGKAIEDPVVCGASRLFSTSADFSVFKDGDLKLEVTNTSPSGNIATASSSYLKSTMPVTVSLASLLRYINIENAAKHAFEGKCSSNGGMIFLDMFSANNSSVPAQSLVATCIDTKWNITNVSFASDLFPDGNVTVMVGHINVTTGDSAEPVKLVLKKATTPVEVKIATPANGYIMNTVTGPKLQVSGSCSLDGKLVRIGFIYAKTNAFKILGTTKCTAGAYSADVDFSSHQDGVVSLSVQQSDDVANIGRQDLSFSKKMKLPQLTLASSSSIVNIGNVAIMKLSGQCSEYADLGQQVTIETVPAMPAQPLFAICQKPLKGKGLGTWSLPNISFTAVPNGTLKVIAKHSDFAGNVAQASLDLEKDTLQPTLTITMPALAKDEHFLINAANASAPISVGGDCNKPGAKITAKNVAPTVETTCTSLKTWNVQLDFSKVPDGKSLVENFSIVDSVGNVATQSLGFDKKTVLPVITIAKPAPASILNISNAHILDVTGSCSEFDDLGMAVNLQLGSIKQQAICVKGTYFVQMSANALENGTLMLTVSQTDYVGNTGSVSINLIKDTLQPTLTITQPKLGKGEHFVINSANVSKPVVVAGDCNKPGAKIVARDVAPEVITSCGADKKWSVSLDFKSVKDGKSLVENFTIIDSADNRATQSIGFDKKVTLPTITIASPREGEYLSIANVHILEVKGTCSEYGVLGTNVNLTLGAVKATAVCNGGSYLVQMSGTALADGAVKLFASQTDYIGNTATASVNLVKSTKMPTLAINSPNKNSVVNDSNASAVPFKGTCSEVGRDVEYSGPISGKVVCTNSKTWSFSGNLMDVQDGILEFTFKHANAAGNQAVQTLSFQKSTCATLLPSWALAPVPKVQTFETASANDGLLPVITPVRVRGPWHGTTSTTLINSRSGVYPALYKCPYEAYLSAGCELVQKWDSSAENLVFAQRLYAGQPFQLKTKDPLAVGFYYLMVFPSGEEAPLKIGGKNMNAAIAPMADSVADLYAYLGIKVDSKGVSMTNYYGRYPFNVLVDTTWASGKSYNSSPTLECTKSAISGYIDPLMIDFGDDNIELSSQRNGVDFDLTGDGLTERISWPLDRRNGFLVLDLDQDGQISGTELFGNYTMGPDGKLAPHGFAALAKYDLNRDGVIDNKDNVFSELRFWYDANRNAKVDFGELETMDQVEIAYIELIAQRVKEIDAYGNTTTLRANVHLRNGGTRIIRDVWFKPLKQRFPQ